MKKYLQKGQRFGRLTVIELSHREHVVKKNSKGNYYKYFYKCLCDCGKECVANEDSLRGNRRKSCGCLRTENARRSLHSINAGKEHNLSKHPLYRTFHGLKKRCYNKNCKSYKDYGGRGITICDEWLNSFKSFYDWAMANGYEKGLSIERIDVNKGYSPENCTWIPFGDQAKNTRRSVFYEYKGEKKILGDWAKQYNLPFTCVRRRIDRGWSLERALNTPNSIRL